MNLRLKQPRDNRLKAVGTVIKRAEFEFNLSGFNTKSCCVIVPGIDASCAVIIMIYIKRKWGTTYM